MLKIAGLLAMSAVVFTSPAMGQIQPRIATHPLLSAAVPNERELPRSIPPAAKSEPGRIELSVTRPISLGWHMIPNGIASVACQQNAVNACDVACGDIGPCKFGCQIGGINNADTCASSCIGLGSPCLNACLGVVNVITACPALSVTSMKVLFGSTSYTISSSSPAILPWQVTGIQMVFSEPVVTGNINSLAGVTATGFTGLGTNTLTWTIAPTSSANITVMLATTGINFLSDAQGYALQNGAPVSQDLKILLGDVNADGVVNASDLVLTNGGIAQQYNILYDVNGDGAISAADVAAVKAKLNTRLPTHP